ncbi:MAG: ABC transporter substrate-binding protein [Proteobacteria bacterium]|nr:ABC transporter substrate-binding protein [Pseudomonadota bacterium]
MNRTIRRFAVSTLMGVLALSILMISSSLPVLAGESDQIENGWVWTKKFPKPSWWRWDEVYNKEKPVRGGYFQTASTRYIGLMNPNHWPVNDWSTLVMMYDRLLYPDGSFKAAVPWLATQWEFENQTTVLMKLRKGVEFHDGGFFNAHSVKYQIDWIKDRKNGAWSRNWIKPVESIDVVDEYTVRWHLKYPWAGFADIMSNVPGMIMSTKALKGDVALQEAKRLKNKVKVVGKKVAKAEKKYEQAAAKGGAKAKKTAAKLKKARKKLAALEKYLKKAKADSEGAVGLDSKAIGSGAFMVEETRPGNYLKLKRNPNWWFGKSIGKPDMPYYDGRKITVIPEPSVRLANLIAGKLDWMNVQKSQYPQVKNDPNLNIWITPLNFTTMMAFNQKEGPFTDIRVRKAVSHAIDRKAVIAANERGFGRVASCFFMDDHYAHNPNLKPVTYNPELSKKLLAQAGYPKGLTVRGVLYSDTGSVRFGQIIKAMLKRVNINWEIEMHDPVAAADKYRNLEYELGVLVGTYIKGPDSAITTFYDPDAEEKNKRIENPKVMAMIKAARQELDFEKRKKMYWDIEKALYDNYDDAWLYHYTLIAANRKQVRGYNREMGLAAGDAYRPTHPGWFKNGRRR